MSKPRSKYGLLGRFNPEDLYNAFLGMEERQQLLTVVGGVFLLLFLLVLPVTCASSKISSMESDYEKSKKSRDDFMARVGTYQASKEALGELQKQMAQAGGGLSPALIEGMATEVGMQEGIKSLKGPINLGSTEFYDEEGIDGVISKITLEQLVQFLTKVESHPNPSLKIKKLQIKPVYGKREEMTATFTVSTIKLKTEE